MEPKDLLAQFIELLKKENRYIIQSIREKEASQQLMEIVKQKEEILQKILSLEKEDIEPFKSELEEIDHWTQRNRALAINNMEFINEVFEAIYSQKSPTQYTKDGTIKKQKEGLFNKKV